jgi:hypothetical protein
MYGAEAASLYEREQQCETVLGFHQGDTRHLRALYSSI